MMNVLQYRRISLKLSGEAMGGNGETLDFEKVEKIACQLRRLQEYGVETGVTIGGGNIWRGRSGGEMDRNRADHMGMLATVINSLALQDCLVRMGVPTLVLSSVDMPRIVESYSSRAALTALSVGKIVIFAGGSGLPYFSTDTAAALKAAEINADALFLAKNVDAIYSADPKLDHDAVRYSHLSYDQVIAKGLKAADLTAITLCKEQNIPVLAFAMAEEDNIIRAVKGEQIGTLIDNKG